jgi:hypothetical protein
MVNPTSGVVVSSAPYTRWDFHRRTTSAFYCLLETIFWIDESSDGGRRGG